MKTNDSNDEIIKDVHIYDDDMEKAKEILNKKRVCPVCGKKFKLYCYCERCPACVERYGHNSYNCLEEFKK